MVNEFVGEIHIIKETEEISAKFQKREFVLNDHDDRFPQLVLFELTQDKVDDILAFNVGDMVKVKYNIRGREWTSPQGDVRYFVSLNAWRIEKVGPAGQGDGPVSRQADDGGFMDGPYDKDEMDGSIDDIPFG